MPAPGFGEVEVVQLGDVIDGCNATMNASETALAAVLNVLSRPGPPSQLWECNGWVTRLLDGTGTRS